MINKFPLYRILKKDSSSHSKIPSGELYSYFADTIKKMPSDEHELIFVIICFHCQLNKKKRTASLYSLIPYGGNKINDAVTFNFTKLPVKLQRILFAFCQKFNAR